MHIDMSAIATKFYSVYQNCDLEHPLWVLKGLGDLVIKLQNLQFYHTFVWYTIQRYGKIEIS